MLVPGITTEWISYTHTYSHSLSCSFPIQAITEYWAGSPGYTMGPCWLSVLYTTVCTPSTWVNFGQTSPRLSAPPPLILRSISFRKVVISDSSSAPLRCRSSPILSPVLQPRNGSHPTRDVISKKDRNPVSQALWRVRSLTSINSEQEQLTHHSGGLPTGLTQHFSKARKTLLPLFPRRWVQSFSSVARVFFKLTYSVVWVSAVQQRDPATHTCVSFFRFFLHRLLQGVEYSSLRFTLDPCWSSVYRK